MLSDQITLMQTVLTVSVESFSTKSTTIYCLVTNNLCPFLSMLLLFWLWKWGNPLIGLVFTKSCSQLFLNDLLNLFTHIATKKIRIEFKTDAKIFCSAFLATGWSIDVVHQLRSACSFGQEPLTNGAVAQSLHQVDSVSSSKWIKRSHDSLVSWGLSWQQCDVHNR